MITVPRMEYFVELYRKLKTNPLLCLTYKLALSYENESKSNAFFFSKGIITYIIHQNEVGPQWIISLLLNIVTISLNSNVLPLNESMYPCLVKFFLIVLWAISSLQFSLPHHWHNVCLLKPLSWGWRDNSLRVLNLVSMADAVKFFTQMKWLSPSSGCLCVVEYYHAEEGHYWLARFSAFKYN